MIIITLIFLFVDILSKAVVSKYLVLEKSVRLINNFLYITHVRNTGAAWSMFSSSSIFVLIISMLVIIGIVLYINKNKPKNNIEKISYALILGGAFGNFINRLFLGYVIDFIDVKIFGYDYPIFNFADAFIVIGVIILAIYTWRCNFEYSSKRK